MDYRELTKKLKSELNTLSNDLEYYTSEAEKASRAAKAEYDKRVNEVQKAIEEIRLDLEILEEAKGDRNQAIHAKMEEKYVDVKKQVDTFVSDYN